MPPKCSLGIGAVIVRVTVSSALEPWIWGMQVKEIVYPLGATVDVREIRLGDETMSVLEIWGAEYQENDCLLIRAADRGLLEGICARERALMQVFLGARRLLCYVKK